MTTVKYIYQVEKFELGKEEYSKRTDTVQVFIFKYNFFHFAWSFTLQAYLKKNKLGKYNEEEMAALTKEKEEREAAEAKMVGVNCSSRKERGFHCS